ISCRSPPDIISSPSKRQPAALVSGWMFRNDARTGYEENSYRLHFTSTKFVVRPLPNVTVSKGPGTLPSARFPRNNSPVRDLVPSGMNAVAEGEGRVLGRGVVLGRMKLLIAAGMLLASLPGAKSRPAADHAVFYTITRPGTSDTSWLFGTMHLLESSYVDTMPRVMRALR